MEMSTYAVGKRFIHKGKKVKAIAETDSGNVKLDNGEWTYYGKLTPIDGTTKGFKVFALPVFEDNAKLAA